MRYHHLPILILLFLHLSAQAVIYGHDDRKDIYQVPWLKNVARSVAVVVPNLFLSVQPDGTYSVTDTESLGQSGSSFVCPGERFEKQPSLGVCSAFLIGDRFVLTAGHCVLPNGIVDHQFHPFCEDFSYYFDYNMKGPNDYPTTKIPASRIYGCKSVLRAENINAGEDGISGNDFALIELDRPVTADIQPLPIITSAIQVGDFVYTMGHPTGLPAKFSGLSAVLKLDQPHYFSVNLDTEGGNSGGVVLNAKNEVAGILVSGYQLDYYDSAPNNCQKANSCDENGLNCRESSSLDQKSNFVQKIETVLPYLPLGAGAGT